MMKDNMKAGSLLIALLLTVGCLGAGHIETAWKWLEPIQEEPWQETLSALPSASAAAVLSSETKMDGQIWITGKGTIVFQGASVGMVVGDLYTEYSTGEVFSALSRGYLSFNITPIPKDAQVEKALLYLFQYWVVHGKPFEIGSVYIKRHPFPDEIFRDYTEMELTAADTEIWGRLPSSPEEFLEWKMVSNSTWEGWKVVDVTDWIRVDVREGGNHSQFMLALFSCTADGEFVCRESDNDKEKDVVIYSTGEGLPGGLKYIPHLVVIYTIAEG